MMAGTVRTITQSRAEPVTPVTAGTAREPAFEKVVIVTRKTELESLVERFSTVGQARFYLEQAGQTFEPIAAQHQVYHQALDQIRRTVPKGMKHQVIERALVPQYAFQPTDLIITVGPDGLVVNVAKYAGLQPILAVNPDPRVIDGVLLPFSLQQLGGALQNALTGAGRITPVTLANARLNDGQHLLAFNDLFIGASSHVSARYHLRQGEQHEQHSSSGVIVTTGAGSTGWLQSVYAGAAGIITALGGTVHWPENRGRLPWDTDHLVYTVREPFPSKTSQTRMVFGLITRDQPLVIDSHMALNGVIFSDGIEQDYLQFNAGATVTIGLAPQKARLLVP